MKKSVIFGVLLVSSMSAQAGLFDTVATSGWPTKDSIGYKIDAYGYDLRAYEWTPEGNPDITCLTVVGSNENSPYVGLQCFPKMK